MTSWLVYVEPAPASSSSLLTVTVNGCLSGFDGLLHLILQKLSTGEAYPSPLVTFQITGKNNPYVAVFGSAVRQGFPQGPYWHAWDAPRTA